MPVTAIGNASLVVNTLTKVKRKNKSKFVRGVQTLLLTNMLIVPGMPCRLFSSRWGFERDNIRTYLNDDRYLALPSGSCVPFKDTPKHYVVAAADDNALATGINLPTGEMKNPKSFII